jgi:hypothetical protein
MHTLASDEIRHVSATGVRFVGNSMHVTLDDGQEISVSLDRTPWLDWLAKANMEQRANWSIEPGGFAIYWEDLDDGIEVRHLLQMQHAN